MNMPFVNYTLTADCFTPIPRLFDTSITGYDREVAFIEIVSTDIHCAFAAVSMW